MITLEGFVIDSYHVLYLIITTNTIEDRVLTVGLPNSPNPPSGLHNIIALSPSFIVDTASSNPRIVCSIPKKGKGGEKDHTEQ